MIRRGRAKARVARAACERQGEERQQLMRRLRYGKAYWLRVREE
jgi:hypothetical protein